MGTLRLGSSVVVPSVMIPSGSANIQSLSITPTTSQQTITATSGVDGYSPITVNAVTNAIDPNIVSSNIKNGVVILGKTGTFGPSSDYYIERIKDANNKLTLGSNLIKLTGFTDIGDYALAYAYYNNQNITGAINLPDLTAISGNYACYNMFFNCTEITSANLNNLTTISGNYACSYMFSGCSKLLSFSFSNLNSLTGQTALRYMFQNCTTLGMIYFNKLNTTSFGSYRNQFTNMLSGCSNVTLHFPSNLQSTIQTMDGYSTTAPFGASSGTISFDLPATY